MRAERLNDPAKAGDIIGMAVQNYQNDKLGKVEELAVDVESGRVVLVILSSGGFAGIGDRLTAVPPGALHRDATNRVLHLDATKETVKGAPAFERAKWAETFDSADLASLRRHYGQESASRDARQDTVLLGQRDTEDSLNTVSTRKTNGTWDKERIQSDTPLPLSASRLGHVQKASALVGLPVQNLQDEKLGKVDNVLVDLPSGRIVAVIVSSGGFLGLGDELSAVPPTALQWTADRSILRLDASKEMLSAAPHFKADQWPDFSDATYADGVYRAYRLESYFGTNATTARNVPSPKDGALTPLDQGNSAADLDTTAQIRKGVLAESNLSVNARNVKIITIDGRVTLRGPVNSAEEKRLIGQIADGIARAENVDNQLEAPLPTASIN